MIDTLDAKILAELDFNCRQSITQIARNVKASREVVTYRIKRMEEQGIIQQYITSINPHKLGLQLFRVYLQIENNKERKQALLKQLLHSRNIYWMGEFEGTWDYIMVVSARNQTEFYDWKNEFFSEYQDIIIKRATGVVVDVQQYSRKFLAHAKPRSILWGGAVEHIHIDTIEQKLIDILANNARESIVTLARKTNTTVDTVLRKLKRLEKEKIIIQYRIAIDFNALHLSFFKAFVSLKGLTAQHHARLSEYLLHNKQCAYYIRILASWDCEPEFLCKDYHEFHQVINTFRADFADIVRSVETTIINKEWWLPGYSFHAASK